MGRMLNNKMLERVLIAETIIYNWMLNKGITISVPEECIDELVSQNIYKYDSKKKAFNFREDLRTLRDNERLDVFTKIRVTQDKMDYWHIERLIV